MNKLNLQNKPHTNKLIVMVVNNQGSNDLRVVKEAEQIVLHGYKCCVVCVHKAGFKQQEILNGVEYYRVKLNFGIMALVLGYIPSLVVFFNKKFMKPELEQKISDIDNVNKKEVAQVKLGQKIKKTLISPLLKFSVIHQLAVRYRQGAYLYAFFQVLKNKKAAIYHAHELSVLESVVLAANGRPIVYDSHELERHRNNNWPKKSFVKYLRYEQKYIDYVSAVIAVSNGCGDEIKKHYKIDNVEIVRNVPMLSMLRNTNKKLRESLTLDKSTPLIVYTGSITFNRGLEIMIESLDKLNGFHFVCVGPYNEDTLNDILERAKKHNVENQFHFIDKVAPEILISFISDADIAVSPIQNTCLSYFYCLPNKIFEAMYAGIPVIASNFPDMTDLINENEIGETCNMNDVDEIVEHIRTVYAKRDTYFNKTKLLELKEKYSFENECFKIVGIYERLLLV